MIASCSALRNRPLFTRMQDSCGPTALYSNAAVTAESTPPDKPANHSSPADPLAHAFDRLAGEITQTPLSLAAADHRQKIVQQHAALRRVRDLGVKLQPVDRQPAVPHRSDRAGLRVRQRNEIIGNPRHLIPVTHPDIRLLGESGQQSFRSVHVTAGPAVLARRCALHLSAEQLASQLHPVTDPQHGNPQMK
jgi:hypothetical protein